MKFLMAVLIVTVASAIGLVLLQTFAKKSEPPKAEPPKAEEPKAEPAKDAALKPAPAASAAPNPAPAPAPKPEEPPLSKVVGEVFEKLEWQVETWKPAAPVEAIRTAKAEVLKVILAREQKK